METTAQISHIYTELQETENCDWENLPTTTTATTEALHQRTPLVSSKTSMSPGRRKPTAKKELVPRTQGDNPGSAKKLLQEKIYFYAFEIPFECGEQQCSIIKVGASDKPGRRLYRFGSAFDRQTSTDDFKCKFVFQQVEDAAKTIAKAKEHPRFLFVVAYKPHSHSDRKNGEDCLRGLLGLPIIDDFTRDFRDSVPFPEILENQCGLTEWVVCRRETVQRVRARFVSGELSGNVEDGDGKYWDPWLMFVHKLKEALPNIPTASLEIAFKHNKGDYRRMVVTGLGPRIVSRYYTAWLVVTILVLMVLIALYFK